MSVSWVPKPDFLTAPVEGDLVVEASAGTGKTFTIEHLVLDAVLAGRPIESILVITFTEKAAAELAHRLRSLFSKLGDRALARPPAGPAWRLDGEARSRLRAARLGLARAPISTIHGFCQRVGAEHGLLGGTPFDQEVVPHAAVFDRAWRRVVEGASATQAGPWLSAWVRRHPLRQLEARARAVDGLGAEVAPPFDPEAWTQAWAALRRCPRSDWVQRAAAGPRRLRGAAAELLRWTEAHPEAPAALMQAPDDWTTRAVGLAAHLGPDGAPLMAAVEAWAPTEAALLQVLGPGLRAEAAAVKADQGWQTYDDMIDRLDRAVEVDGLRAEIRSEVELVLVDEFQDTDGKQWRILRRLFHGHCPLILVGDPKQSIYGFRGADVGVFSRAAQALEGARQLALDRCHRSTPELVRCLNAAFGEGGILRSMVHRPVASARAPALGLRQRGRLLPPVRLIPVELQDAPARQVRRQWARAVVRHVVDLIAGGVTKSDEGSLRPEDVFVLCRTTKEARSIAEQLREVRVPVQLFEREGVLRGPEAGQILDVLQALAEPDRPGPAARSWLTAYFGLDPADLATARDLPPEHPLLLRLRTWSEAARRRAWDELLHGMVEAAAERARSNPERWGALDAHRRVLAELGAFVRREGAALEEIIHWLAEARDGGRTEAPAEAAGAVRVSTMHGAKGLESEAVILFGGLGRPRRPLLPHRDEQGAWRVHVGGAPPASAEAQAEAEEERLLYVALSRARSLLVLPEFDAEPEGPIRHLQRGLRSLESLPELVERPSLPEARAWTEQLEAPPPPPPAVKLGRIRVETSFSDLKRRAAADREQREDRDDPLVERPILETELPGGPATGRCIHALLETGRWGEWGRAEIEAALETEGLSVELAGPIERLLLRTVQRPIALPGRTPIRLMDGHRHIRELDFTWWRGGHAAFVRGFVDLVLELEDGVWVLDYKSDLLPDYGPERLDVHVRSAYGLQADLYVAAVQAHLQEAARRVRGVAYLFVRAEPEGEDGEVGVWARLVDGGEKARVTEALRGRVDVRAR